MNPLPSRFPLSILLVLLALGSAARAQVKVPVSTLPRVGVEISGANGSGVTSVISADLRRTGMISPVGGGTGDYVATGKPVAMASTASS